MNSFFILLFSLNALCAYSAKLKNNCYTDKNKFFSLQIEKKWQRDIDEQRTEFSSVAAFVDGEGRIFKIEIEECPPQFMETIKGNESDTIKAIKAIAEETWLFLFENYPGSDLIEHKSVKIPNYGYGHYLFLIMPKTGLLFDLQTKIPTDAYRGILVFLSNNKLVRVHYMDSSYNSFLRVKLKEDPVEFNNEYIEKLMEVTRNLHLFTK